MLVRICFASRRSWAEANVGDVTRGTDVQQQWLQHWRTV